MSLIVLPGFVYLSSELLMTFHWYMYYLQPYTGVILVKTATQLLKFSSAFFCASKNNMSKK